MSFALAAALVIMTIFSFRALATGSALFYIPDDAVGTGEQFEVSVEFTADDVIGWVDTNFVYDSSAVQFVSGDGASGGGGILTIHDFPSSQTDTLTLTLRFIALKQGSSQMSISNCAIFAQDGSLLGSPSAYASITAAEGTTTVTTTPDSSPDSEDDSSMSDTTTTITTPATIETDENGYPTKGALTNITLSAGELVPAFSPDIYNYVVKVDNSIEYLEIEGTTASITDYIWYDGSNYLQVGDNIRAITVTADDGTERKYTIDVQRAEAAQTTESVQQPDDTTQTETVTTTAGTDSKSVKIIEEKENALDQYKKILMPALGIVMFVLVLALVIIVVWLKKKAQEHKLEEQAEKKTSKKNKRK